VRGSSDSSPRRTGLPVWSALSRTRLGATKAQTANFPRVAQALGRQDVMLAPQTLQEFDRELPRRASLIPVDQVAWHFDVPSAAG